MKLKRHTANPLLSVIVPVYNAGSYLRRCLESICQQTYPNLEIICVNDGSTDGSLAILREYEAKDSRIRVVDKPNGGVSSARNAALDIATGDWVANVDPDDYLKTDAFSQLMKQARDDIDLIAFGVSIEVEAESGLEANAGMLHAWGNSRLDGAKHTLTPDCFPVGGWYLWNKLYRRSIIEANSLRLDESISHNEDFCFLMRYCAHAKQAFFCREELYIYYQHRASAINTYTGASRRCESYLKSMTNVLDEHSRMGLMEAYLPFWEQTLWRVGTRLHQLSTLERHPVLWRERLLQELLNRNVHTYTRLGPILYCWQEQARCAQRAQHLFNIAVDSVVSSSPWKQNALHIAIPLNESHAGRALLTACGLRQTAATGQDVCVHFICDDISEHTRKRLTSLAAEHFAVVLHKPAAAQMRFLPPMAQDFPRRAHLKMMVPRLLTNVERVLVLSPGILVRGKLPALETVAMEGMPVAVLGKAEDSKNMRRVALKVERYDSCAALLMDVRLMLGQQYSENWLAAHMLNPRQIQHAETDAFNLAFAHAKVCLPKQWGNYLQLLSATQLKQAACEQRELLAAMPIDIPGQQNRAPQWSRAALPPDLLPMALQYELLRRRYRYYKIMSMLTWGRRRRHYKERRKAYQQVLRRIRQAVKVKI